MSLYIIVGPLVKSLSGKTLVGGHLQTHRLWASRRLSGWDASVVLEPMGDPGRPIEAWPPTAANDPTCFGFAPLV